MAAGMSIRPFLGDQKFDPETRRIMSVALEMARASVKRDWGGIYASHIIAKRIIELAKAGERNPDVTLRTGSQLLSEQHCHLSFLFRFLQCDGGLGGNSLRGRVVLGVGGQLLRGPFQANAHLAAFV
jgi:hypothetical protein